MMYWERLLIFNIIPVTILFNSGVANSYDDNSVTSKPLMDITYNENAHIKIKGEYIPFSEDGITTSLRLLYTQVHSDRSSSGRDNSDWCNGLPKSLKDKIPPEGGWIALIFVNNPPTKNRSQSCSCLQKLRTAQRHNASAAIILLPKPEDDHCRKPKQPYVDIVGVAVPDQNEVSKLKSTCQEQYPNEMYCSIKKQPKQHDKQFRVSKTSVLFVLVSFILLMCISLAWLVFYYVQRFRHIYRNDRKEKQLLSAAKKAISKLKTISFNAATLEGEDDSCAVCLENYKDGESIRILPCKHLFHKTCIDPWLLNHRTCPMCKSNILKSLGVEIPDNMDLSQYDMESRRISRDALGDNVNVQSSPATSSPQHHGDLDNGDHAMVGVEVSGGGAGELDDELPHTCDLPSTSVFTSGASSSQAWPEEPNVVSASVCSSTSSMLSDTDSERSTVALVSVVQKV